MVPATYCDYGLQAGVWGDYAVLWWTPWSITPTTASGAQRAQAHEQQHAGRKTLTPRALLLRSNIMQAERRCVNYIGAFAAIVPSPRSCCAQNVHTRDVNADQAAQELRELRSRLAVYAAAIFHHQKHGKRILENANCFHHQKHGKKIASGDVKKL